MGAPYPRLGRNVRPGWALPDLAAISEPHQQRGSPFRKIPDSRDTRISGGISGPREAAGYGAINWESLAAITMRNMGVFGARRIPRSPGGFALLMANF